MQHLDVYWHIHHEELKEILTDPVLIRIQYILANKLTEEIPLRLTLLKKVNPLPPVLEEIKKEWDSLSDDDKHSDPGWVIEEKFWLAYADNVTEEEWEVLHQAQCPNCPWDGITIFTTYNDALHRWAMADGKVPTETKGWLGKKVAN